MARLLTGGAVDAADAVSGRTVEGVEVAEDQSTVVNDDRGSRDVDVQRVDATVSLHVYRVRLVRSAGVTKRAEWN